MTSEKKRWQERYEKGNTPWDSNKADFNLTKLVSSGEILPGQALEIGCGTGTNAVWLAENGFIVTGLDISGIAIEAANERAASADVKCSFIEADFLDVKVPVGSYDFIYDRGCLHSMDNSSSRQAFVAKLASLLKERGLWLSIIGNADAPPREIGPPTLTAKEVTSFLEPHFQIISLTRSCFEEDISDSPPAWVCLVRKRVPTEEPT